VNGVVHFQLQLHTTTEYKYQRAQQRRSMHAQTYVTREFHMNKFSRSILVAVAGLATALGVTLLSSSGVAIAGGPIQCGPGMVPVVVGGVWACKQAPVDPGRHHRHHRHDLAADSSDLTII
jgi:hypothetical protein